MKSNVPLLKKHRRYSVEFKKQIVAAFESGEHSVPQLEKLHGVPNKSIYNRIYKFFSFDEKGYRAIE